MNHLYILLTVFLTVYGQIIIKWQVKIAGLLPQDNYGKVKFITSLLLNPWVISSFVCAFLASLSWMAAMSKFSLSYAYPLTTSLSFILILTLSFLFFKDTMTLSKFIGITLMLSGMIIASQTF